MWWYIFIKIGEWDYGSYVALSFCINYNDFLDFINKQFLGNLCQDDLTIIVLNNKNINDYKIEIEPYNELFNIEHDESYVKKGKKSYNGHISDFVEIENTNYAKIIR